MSDQATSLWGGRFQGAADPRFLAFQESLSVDSRLFAVDVEGSRAWARALGHAEVLTADEVTRIVAGLDAVEADVAKDPALLAESSAEDIHSFVEQRLGVHAGDLAKKLHTGRSRNDQVATDLKLYLRGTVADLDATAADLQLALAELAERTAALPLPGYTHLQRAQPITAGHHALAYVEMLARDRSRLSDALARMDTCPLGSAALAGTAFPVNRETLAVSLGFSAPTANSLDTVSDRDHATELAFACAQILVHLSRLAEDWIFFCSQEAGFLELSDAVCTGSSLMPQKKNPDAMELIRGKSARTLGNVQTLLALSKGLPLAYDRDLQEDKSTLFDSLDTTTACLAVMALAVRGAEYDEVVCRRAAATGYLNATDVADLLVHAGVPFRTAHERAGQAVVRALEHGCEVEDMPAEVLTELLPELTGDLKQLLSPEAVLARRDVTGGTAPTRVAAAAEAWLAALQP